MLQLNESNNPSAISDQRKRDKTRRDKRHSQKKGQGPSRSATHPTFTTLRTAATGIKYPEHPRTGSTLFLPHKKHPRLPTRPDHAASLSQAPRASFSFTPSFLGGKTPKPPFSPISRVDLDLSTFCLPNSLPHTSAHMSTVGPESFPKMEHIHGVDVSWMTHGNPKGLLSLIYTTHKLNNNTVGFHAPARRNTNQQTSSHPPAYTTRPFVANLDNKP